MDMWFRGDLKDAAKANIKKNYVIIVILALIFAFFEGTLGSSNSAGRRLMNFNDTSSEVIIADNSLHFPHELIGAMLGVIIVVAIISIILKALVFNPFLVGCHNAFLINRKDTPVIGDVLSAF